MFCSVRACRELEAMSGARSTRRKRTRSNGAPVVLATPANRCANSKLDRSPSASSTACVGTCRALLRLSRRLSTGSKLTRLTASEPPPLPRRDVGHRPNDRPGARPGHLRGFESWPGWSGINGARELQCGHGAAVGLVARCCPAAVRVGDGADDCQSQAGASVVAGAPGVWACEALEGVWQELCREAGTGVGDFDRQIGAGGPGGDHDRRSWWREPQGVVDQVIGQPCS